MQSSNSEQQARGNILKEFAAEILEVFRKAGQAISDLQIAYSSPDIKQGQNFIGHFAGSEVLGVALYFARKSDSYEIYIGELIAGKPRRKGIKAELNLDNNHKQINFSKFDALLLYNWEGAKNGYYICKNGNKQTHFKGSFNEDLTMKSGVQEERYSGALISRYDGMFQNNKFHGMGKITMPSQYEYKGKFEQNNKEGLGKEHDFLRKTIYVGGFAANQKDGYGEIIYEGRKSLKGFWKNGIMANGEGVFVDEKGDVIESYDKRYIPII